MTSPALVLASSSPARRERLATLGLTFTHASPDIDETPIANETPHQLVARLARQKAEALSSTHPDALIIGSDQVCIQDGASVGKPGSFERAFEQLSRSAGKRLTFLTGLVVLDTRTDEVHSAVEAYHVTFRALSSREITHYLQRETPYACAGSFKMEGLGITLFERLEGDDPNTLIGLPLIRLCKMLKAAGLDPLG